MSEQICYENPFLKEVIFRVDFATPLEGVVTSVPSTVLREIMKAFPIAEPQTVQSQEFQISGQTVSSTTHEIKQWVYHGREREKSMILQPESLTMTIKPIMEHLASLKQY
ncbi:TIGR04255 family protein [Shewanella algae]|uniref:TIGR04255 family protein n=1 Tax=Shewanella algae TaxID=38313 RepID=UPI001BEDD2BF|nr:TIGR04255 family protein [Shewanella algae]BCV48516.1 hypothetical protein TUM17382_12090 [Shewanella algae]